MSGFHVAHVFCSEDLTRFYLRLSQWDREGLGWQENADSAAQDEKCLKEECPLHTTSTMCRSA